MKEKCIYKFDNIKVFLMILVIIAHTLINSYGDKGRIYTFYLFMLYDASFYFYLWLFIEKGAIVKKELHSSFIAMYYFYDNK